MANTDTSMFHAYAVGDIRVCVVSDGAIRSPIADGMMLNASANDIRAALREANLPDDALVTTFAPVLLQTNGRTVLVDTGLGPDMGSAPDAPAGHLVKNLLANGIAPENVDLVVVSHFHSDHINGLISRSGPVFPRAEIAVPEKEWAFWMSDTEQARASAGRISQLFANNRRVFDPLRARVRRYDAGEEIVAGLEAFATYGHSIGHMSFWLRSAGEAVFLQSDVSNQAELFLPHPDWQSAFDQFPEQAVTVRREIYDRLAADRIPIQAFHHPFPGRCRVEKTGKAYRRIPLA